jgi:hypothetical protein
VPQAESFDGKCPKCEGYDTRIRSEVITYGSDKAAPGMRQEVLSTSRVFSCNTCRHSWTEKVGDEGPATEVAI